MPKQMTTAATSEEPAANPAACNAQPVQMRQASILSHAPERTENDQLFHYFSGIEVFPISRSEISWITGTPESQLVIYEMRGIILRSAKNEWRPDSKFAFFSYYDLYRLAIIQGLHLLPFCGNEIFENLIDELLDEICLEIDQALCDRQIRTIGAIKELIFFHFSERRHVWQQFWLLDGERFRPSVAASICLSIWVTIFERTSKELEYFASDIKGARL